MPFHSISGYHYAYHQRDSAQSGWVPRRRHPKYVVLSRTWGEKEVGLDDFTSAHPLPVPYKLKFNEIQYCCSQAKRGGPDNAWVLS